MRVFLLALRPPDRRATSVGGWRARNSGNITEQISVCSKSGQLKAKPFAIGRALTAALLKVSALVGVTVSWEHPTTLQQLNELDILTDAKVEAILRLSE